MKSYFDNDIREWCVIYSSCSVSSGKVTSNIHTYTHTHVRAHTHTHTYINNNNNTHTHMNTHAHTHMRAHMHAYTPTHRNDVWQQHMHVHTCAERLRFRSVRPSCYSYNNNRLFTVDKRARHFQRSTDVCISSHSHTHTHTHT